MASKIAQGRAVKAWTSQARVQVKVWTSGSLPSEELPGWIEMGYVRITVRAPKTAIAPHNAPTREGRPVSSTIFA